MLYQYGNPDNAGAHYATTGPEILADLPVRHPLRRGPRHHRHADGRRPLPARARAGHPDRRRRAALRRPGLRAAQPRRGLRPRAVRRLRAHHPLLGRLGATRSPAPANSSSRRASSRASRRARRCTRRSASARRRSRRASARTSSSSSPTAAGSTSRRASTRPRRPRRRSTASRASSGRSTRGPSAGTATGRRRPRRPASDVTPKSDPKRAVAHSALMLRHVSSSCDRAQLHQSAVDRRADRLEQDPSPGLPRAPAGLGTARLAATILSLLGSLLVYSATRGRTDLNKGDPQYFLLRHLLNLVIGGGLAALMVWCGHRTDCATPRPCIFVLPVLLIPAGADALSAPRSTVAQLVDPARPAASRSSPSELVKVGVILAMAIVLAAPGGRGRPASTPTAAPCSRRSSCAAGPDGGRHDDARRRVSQW